MCEVHRRARNAGVKVAVAAVVAVIPGAEGTVADVAVITLLTAVKLENVLMLGHLDRLRSVGGDQLHLRAFPIPTRWWRHRWRW